MSSLVNSLVSGLARPSWVEIDLGAVTHNVALARGLVGENVKIYGVCKANAMGCGLVPVARRYAESGVDALAVADPADVVNLREGGLTLPILLFASTLPEQAADVAALDVIPVVHDLPSLAAFAALGRPIDVFFKIDCGMGRLGFSEHRWDDAFARAAAAPTLNLTGLYTHMSKPEDRDTTLEQAARFGRACDAAQAAGFHGFERVAASSRVVLGYPELHLSGVDPGRMLLGMLDAPWNTMAPMRPAVRAVKARIIQIQEHERGARLGIGYGSPIVSDRALRTAVIPIGFGDGLNHAPPLGDVLVCGRRAPVLGRRSIEFSLLDVSDIPGADIGSEAVVLGTQGGEEITPKEISETVGVPTLELIARLAHNTRRVYVE